MLPVLLLTNLDLVERGSIPGSRRSSSRTTALEEIGTSPSGTGCCLPIRHLADHPSRRRSDVDSIGKVRNTARPPLSTLCGLRSTSPCGPSTSLETNDDSFVTACDVNPEIGASGENLVTYNLLPSPSSEEKVSLQPTRLSNNGTGKSTEDIQSGGSTLSGLGKEIPFEHQSRSLPVAFWDESRLAAPKADQGSKPNRELRNPCQTYKVIHDVIDVVKWLPSIELPSDIQAKDPRQQRQTPLAIRTNEQRVRSTEGKALALLRKVPGDYHPGDCHPRTRQETVLCGALSRLRTLPRNVRVRIQLYACGVTPPADPLDEAAKIPTPTVLRDHRPQYNEHEAPREFLKMTSAEKKAFYSSPSMNRITFGSTPSTSSLLLQPLNEKFALNAPEKHLSTGPLNLAAFTQFCIYQASSSTTIAAHLQLWSLAEFATNANELRYYGCIPNGIFQLYPQLVRKTECLLATQQLKIRRLVQRCRDWEAAMRKLPRSVKTVCIYVEVPRMCCPKELSVCLWRMQTYAMWSSGRSVGWRLDVTHEA